MLGIFRPDYLCLRIILNRSLKGLYNIMFNCFSVLKNIGSLLIIKSKLRRSVYLDIKPNFTVVFAVVFPIYFD